MNILGSRCTRREMGFAKIQSGASAALLSSLKWISSVWLHQLGCRALACACVSISAVMFHPQQ